MSGDSGSAESSYNRSYFYVGGDYVDDERGDGQHVMAGQMYVEKLFPLHGARHPWPIVFIQGAGQTSTVSLKFGFILNIGCKRLIG